MHCYHSTSFKLPLPPEHRFPMEKYDLLPRQLLHEGTISENEIIEQAFHNNGEQGKFNPRFNPNMAAAWMLPPGPGATSSLNPDFNSYIVKDNFENNFEGTL